MVIIFHLFDRSTLSFSELERAIPAVSQKMLIQQLRELERDGIVARNVYPQVPPKVEYHLTNGARRCAPLWTLCSNGPRLAGNDCIGWPTSAVGTKQTCSMS